MPSPTHALTPSTPAAPSFAAAPQSMNAFLPMMMFMGRRRGGRGGGGGYSSGAYDPYECSATCAAQQGYCGKPEASLLQLTESAPAVMPLVAPLGALPSVPPLAPMTPGLAPMAPGLAPMPPGDSSYSFMFPMMMMMGGRRRRSNSFGSNPMLTSCIQTCQANPGCGPPPAADAGGGGGETKPAETEPASN